MILAHDGIKYDSPEKQAVLFIFDETTVWIPRSLMEAYDENVVEVPTWFAEKEEIEIYEL